MRPALTLALVCGAAGAEAQFAGRQGAVLAHDAAECAGLWAALDDPELTALFDGITADALDDVQESRRPAAQAMAAETRAETAARAAADLRIAKAGTDIHRAARATGALAQLRAPCDFMQAEALADAENRTME